MRQTWTDANLDHATVRGAILQSANLSGANLEQADFSVATLRKAVLKNAQLNGTNLWNANLEEVSDADLASAVTTHPPFPPDLGGKIDYFVAEPKPPKYTVVELFYGTDRSTSGDSDPRRFYGSGRGSLVFGRCEVSIPRDHVMGELEAPSIWRLEFREDASKHVTLLKVQPLQQTQFLVSLETRFVSGGKRDVFVFIHGFNVSLEAAARSVAQLAYDLAFDGISVLYSWPSEAAVLNYHVDESNVEWTQPHLEEFLTLLAERLGEQARFPAA